jgi:hypothetical protein
MNMKWTPAFFLLIPTFPWGKSGKVGADMKLLSSGNEGRGGFSLQKWKTWSPEMREGSNQPLAPVFNWRHSWSFAAKDRLVI